MTGWELISALRKLPSDALEQDVIFEQEKKVSRQDLDEDSEPESCIVSEVQPWTKTVDRNGNFIKLL